jgi:hypothetical protein
MTRLTLTKDWDSYTIGDFRLENNTWGQRDLINGVDFTQQVTFNSDDITSGVTFSWNWGPDQGRMLAYPEIIVGFKPWNPKQGTDIINAAVSDIKTFDISQEIEISGDTDTFNVSYDLWLTDEPLGGETSITTEIMVWSHRGGLGRYEQNGKIGTYKHDGYEADVIMHDNFGGSHGLHWRYIALLPDKDYLNFTFDMKDVLAYLVRKGLISGDDYVTGYELGSEVKSGSGELKINHLSHTFETFEPANSLNGTSGRDRISGTDGSDNIKSFAGNDLIASGEGADVLTGGLGRDRFVFNAFDGNADEITDFRHGHDKIVLDGDFFDIPETKTSKSAAFSATSPGRIEADAHLFYDRATGSLYYDSDGLGSADDRHLIATLDNHAKLSWSDFQIV